jgi:pyrimidine oxygenase
MMCTVIQADTDSQAEVLVQRYRDGVDMAAVLQMLRSWGAPAERLDSLAVSQGAFMTQTVAGAAATCAAEIAALLDDCEIDGLMLIFADYDEGVGRFGAEILPALRRAFS